MPNPILPLWEYIPDGEPRVFGDRVYLYGSHDRVSGESFCDHKLKVWSADVHDLNHWVCHGDSFRTLPSSSGRPADTPWTDHALFAPDVVEKDGKYYLYAYIVGAKGAVGVSARPEGPFRLLSSYRYTRENGAAADAEVGDDGTFNDAGVLVDEDGRVYVYYGFEHSWRNELDPQNRCEVLPGTLRGPAVDDAETVPPERRFYEASSPRKINGRYYLIYSPRRGNRLAYAIADDPRGPYTYRGYIIDNGVDYPAGNNHGSVACINGQWYVFYHRMTNHTIMSRRACVEKIEILPDGTIPPVEMTSLGFEDALDPYQPTKAEIACVLTGGCYVTELDIFTRLVTCITDGCLMGYKYFDFGEDHTGEPMTLALKVRGRGTPCDVHILLDSPDGEEIGVCRIGAGDGVYRTKTAPVTGRHALYLTAAHHVEGWMGQFFEGKPLFELEEFVFMK